VQLLRLLRVFGALRIVRVRRILKAGKIIRERHGLTGPWAKAVTLLLSLTAAGFVAVVLADPTSESRQWLEQLTARAGLLGVLVAGAIVGVATYLVLTNRGEDDRQGSEQQRGASQDDQRADDRAHGGGA
jgi:hypothetical protein